MKYDKLNLLLKIFFISSLITACSITTFRPPGTRLLELYSPPVEIVRATGYGVAKLNTDYSATHIEMLARRASKVDAYRNLTEAVYGVKISGSTKISDMIIADDHLRSYVAGYLHDAHETSSHKTVEKDGSYIYETMLEMPLYHDFFGYVLDPVAVRQFPQCPNCVFAAPCRYEDKYYYISY